MIADRYPLGVREKWIGGPEHAADVRRVFDRRVEVSVVADARRQYEIDRVHRHECGFDARANSGGRARSQQLAHTLSEVPRYLSSERHQRIERFGLASDRNRVRQAVEQTALGALREIQNSIADGDSDSLSMMAAKPECAERQILDWKIRM